MDENEPSSYIAAKIGGSALKPRVLFAVVASAFLVVGALVLLVATFKNMALMKSAFLDASYYFMLALFAVWATVTFRLFRSEKADLRSFAKTHAAGMALALVFCALAFLSVKPTFRVLADETNLVGVSRAMTFEKKVDNVTEGKYYYQNYQPIARAMEKRPLLFPFFVHLVHSAIGYRVENVFVLNFCVLALLLAMLYALMRNTLGAAGAVGALILVLSQPIVTACSASGGFELFQVFFIALSFVSLAYFLKDSSSPARFQWLWMNLLMLSHTRYESFVFLLITLYLLFGFRYVRAELAAKSWFCLAITPLLLLPIVWQRVLMINHFQQPEGSAIFSLDYFLRYNGLFLKNLFNFGFRLPYANAINLAGIAAIALFVWRVLTGRFAADRRTAHLVFFAAVNLVVSWVIFTSHFLGSMEVPSSARFFLPFCVVLSLAAAAGAAYLVRRIGAHPSVLIPAALVVFALYQPIAVEDRYFKSQVAIREYDIVYQNFLKNLPHRNFLLITELPNFYSVYEYGALHFGTVNQDKDSVLFEYGRRLYSEIYVVQEIRYDTGKPSDDTALDPAFQLVPLLEVQNTAEGFLRISKVINQR